MPKTLSTKQAAGGCKVIVFFCTSLWQTLKQNLAWYSQMRIHSCPISFNKSENKIEGTMELGEKLFYSLATENGDSPHWLYFTYGSTQNNSNPDNSKWQLNLNKSQNFFQQSAVFDALSVPIVSAFCIRPSVPRKYFITFTEAFLAQCTEVWCSPHCTVSQCTRQSWEINEIK